jgi:uncharacterized protein (TIGR00255 family)
MRSMTGFGLGEVRVDDGHVTVELRSVNHRYSDVRVRLPPELLDLTFFVEQLGRNLLGRGRFDLNVRLEGDVLATPSLVPERLRALYENLSELRNALCPESPLSIADLLSAPGVFSTKSPAQDVHLQRAIESAFACALDNLIQMRESEGRNLAHQLLRHVENARRLVAGCHQRAELVAPTMRSKLEERLERLLTGTSLQLDEVRLEQEIALVADRSDVTEEITRIGSHLDQFTSMLESAEPVGRRLDFLLQEVARESNTLGAKSQDSGLSHLVVELKAEVEKMREQVQNVE